MMIQNKTYGLRKQIFLKAKYVPGTKSTGKKGLVLFFPNIAEDFVLSVLNLAKFREN